MRLFSSRVVALTATALLLVALTPSTTSADIAIASRSEPNTAPRAAVWKRQDADHDHDHDHDHPTTTTPTAPTGTSTSVVPASIVTNTPAPNHGDHDHDHDHDHGHDHSKEEDAHAGHSHGPARVCEPEGHDHGEYVMWHHIVALFILIVVAGFGCVIPMIVKDSPRSRFMVQLGKYFGAGVVLSVAFVHILPEALFGLTHPCLSKAWTDDYPGYAPLIMMITGLTMLVIEYLASSLVLKVEAQTKRDAALAAGDGSQGLEANHSDDHSHDGNAAWDKHDHHHDHEHPSPASTPTSGKAGHETDVCNHAHGLTLLQCGPGVSTKISTYMLEIGIALHSVFIENSVSNLIATGVCNSIACGVLLYTAFVTLLGGDILYSERFRTETRASKASYLIAVWLGAISMAVLALWA
ncbi:high-affinity Zn(2+) transporter zrt1 [Lunasporangiospora selenospora]|uniref:High-affinity Zn(2+) transporter zrt1 n=1 Tax=Lunasporangiospora selenospora TaxID=979761 RepID=A0A9P6KB73_9FUNG|nr:high-affinity Zn(2+) transporter zrt1 [Lunasporangiospora selenospora]